ncbi:Hypothetical predicted protein [Paramuricea clavata]|uniref:Uncharacterized protein n=1 Tax=Paramuricea clavata TaxID=317549 RepID=A0A6S7I229_PARCT|nr:Hypothetical predicted protein [Paramuricea clavata]
MDDSFCLTNELPTIMNKNQLSSTIIEIPPSNDEDQHDNLTNATVIVDQLTSPLLAYTKDAPPTAKENDPKLQLASPPKLPHDTMVKLPVAKTFNGHPNIFTSCSTSTNLPPSPTTLRLLSHETSPLRTFRNLITVPLTKHTTNTNKSQVKPNDNSQFVPTLLLSNTMSLTPKTDEIAFTIQQKDIQVGFFTETWLKDSIADDPIAISGYQLFRLDRKNKQHGGVCLYVKNTIESKTLSILHKEDYEVLWCILRPKRLPRGFSNTIAGVLYHPPGANNTAMKEHLKSSLEIIETHYPNSGIVLAAESGPPFGLSDHVTITMIPAKRVNLRPQKTTIKVRDKRPSNVASLGRFLLNISWENILSPLRSSDDKLTTFTEIINYGLNTIMPERSIKVNPNDRPWMTSHLKRLILQRQKAFAVGNNFVFKLLRNKVNRERKRCRKVYYKKKVSNLLDSKPKDWWREVKQLCGQESTRPDLRSMIKFDVEDSDEDLGNRINEAFISVMKVFPPLPEDFNLSTDNDEPISVSETTVERLLRAISVSKASGRDELPNWVLKSFSDILAPAITDLFNASFRECKVPRPTFFVVELRELK